MSHIVGVDHGDQNTRSIDRDIAHEQGIPHRGVHIEIVEFITTNRYLILERSRENDNRLEILGGHVDWLDSYPETYEVAALREICEELNLEYNWAMDQQAVYRRLRPHMSQYVQTINQLSGRAGYNNEWITVFRLRWQRSWKDPTSFNLSRENKSARWYTLDELTERSLEAGAEINTALRLFFQRQNILIPTRPNQENPV